MEELDFHLALTAEELEREGWTPEEAAAEARRRFGDVDGTLDYCARETSRVHAQERWMMWWDDLRQDVHYAFRTLFRSPMYATVVVLTLAAGIAANTTIFSLMNPYLFRALPYADADRLVQVGGFDPSENWDGGRFSLAQISDMVERSRSLEAVGWYYYGVVNLTGGDRAESVNVSYMSGDLFSILGTPPLQGRGIGSADARPGAPDAAVVSQSLFQDRYGADPELVGRTIEVDGTDYTVVGVMPAGFNFPFGSVDLWVPEKSGLTESDRAEMYYLPVARLADGWSPDDARAELDGIHAELAAAHPDTDGRYSGTSVKPLREALNFAWGPLRIAFFMLMGAVVFVLVIACVNVASITLARATARAREVAVRAAVGADRNRLVRQLVTESLLLAVAGGLLGVVLAWAATQFMNGVLPGDLFRVGDVSLDGRVLAFTAVVTLVTPFLFGLAPAMNLARAPLSTVLRTGAGSGSSRSGLRSREALVVLEVTLAIVLVTGTGLMIRSFQEAMASDVGFASESLLVATVVAPEQGYPGPTELDAYFRQAEEALSAIPGAGDVAVASHIPLNHESIGVRYQTADAPGDMDLWPTGLTSRVSRDYFRAAGIPILAGRPFNAADGEDQLAVIVTASLATRLFEGADAVGQTLRYGGAGSERSATIVGVVGDVRYSDLTSPERPHIYRPVEGSTARRRFILVRAAGDPLALANPVRQVLTELDPDVPATLRSFGSVVEENTLVWKIGSLFLGIFGVVAILLAALGIYGLMQFSVTQRSREMGLRLALGAEGGRIQREVVVSGLRLTAVGLLLGVVLAVAGGVAFESVLFGVSAVDPVTLGAVVALFAVVSGGAALIPARRAARVDPLNVLRAE